MTDTGDDNEVIIQGQAYLGRLQTGEPSTS